jgi:hypothetical protein
MHLNLPLSLRILAFLFYSEKKLAGDTVIRKTSTAEILTSLQRIQSFNLNTSLKHINNFVIFIIWFSHLPPALINIIYIL